MRVIHGPGARPVLGLGPGSEFAGLGERAPRPSRIVAFALGVAAIQSLAYLIGVAFFGDDVNLLDLDAEHTVYAWATSSVIVIAAAGCLLSYVRGAGARSLWLAALLAFLSLDEAIGIHERLGTIAERIGLWPELGRLLWVIAYLPLLALIVVEIWRAMGDPTKMVTIVGITLLVGAVGLEAFSWATLVGDLTRSDLPYRAELILEEGAEIAGWICVAAGLSLTAIARGQGVPGGAGGSRG